MYVSGLGYNSADNFFNFSALNFALICEIFVLEKCLFLKKNIFENESEILKVVEANFFFFFIFFR